VSRRQGRAWWGGSSSTLPPIRLQGPFFSTIRCTSIPGALPAMLSLKGEVHNTKTSGGEGTRGFLGQSFVFCPAGRHRPGCCSLSREELKPRGERIWILSINGMIRTILRSRGGSYKGTGRNVHWIKKENGCQWLLSEGL